ncbi:hypothetical protein CANINC_002419 [Pichia inconspicua]|uniref:AAA+ ATPase domain-containing protein n=1 Tax=Pichia inconspicua TaxID=52247 RepID=A0A4V6TTR6_9ASCO|nr:hypothetical protein CANINC_002419 [[Candida] inconspicua]
MSEQPWIEKYRPKELKEVSSQDATTRILEKSLQSANLPHMLFYGPPGTGKTSTILALANELFGPRLMKSRVLELNASDERGISIVRDKIKKFAKMSVSNANEEDLANYPCPSFKLIILDEADSMTSDAQSALRRIMETYSKITRFCLICNYVTKIIDPLTSRCSKFRFRSLNVEIGLNRLKFIAENENVKINDEVLIKILKISNGDLRKSVNLLQSVSSLGDEVDNKSIDELFGYPSDEIIKSLLKLLQDGEIDEIVSFTENELLRKGYSTSNILQLLNDVLLSSTELNCDKKNKVALILYESDVKVAEGCNENIQLLSCLLKLGVVL